MQSRPLPPHTTAPNEEQARERIRIHSFLLPLPQTNHTTGDHVSSLLTKEEEAICNMATD